jgi:hypothetical protein
MKIPDLRGVSQLCEVIDTAFNGEGCAVEDRKVRFVLIASNADGPIQWAGYATNEKDEDIVVTMLQHIITRIEMHSAPPRMN